jgi:16S rRNA (adenine1518-N6/adenine1519-N6)-dimethyltransferase
MPLTPTETRALLEKLGHRPQKKLGQNFLVDGNLVRKSLDMADLPAEATVVEIGPGLGSLTGSLLDAGHWLYATEFDTGLVAHLQEAFAEPIEQARLTLVDADAVKLPLGPLPENKNDFYVVANLPYAISSPWLEAVLGTGRLPRRMVLMLQKESADRYLAKHDSKSYGALAIFLAGSYYGAGIHVVSRRCFYPVPAVDSVLLRLDRRDEPFLFSREVRDLVRRLFTRRRKQLGVLAKTETPEVFQRIMDWLSREELSPTLRPEQVPSKDWRSLRV